MICPQCGTDNRPGARFCARCGALLPVEATVSVPAETVAWTPPSAAAVPPPAPVPEPWSPVGASAPAPVSVPRRFPVLRILSTIYRVLGWIIAVLTALSSLATCIISIAGAGAAASFGEDLGLPIVFGGVMSGVVGGLITLLIGGLFAVSMLSAGEMISLLLAIEENTRAASH